MLSDTATTSIWTSLLGKLPLATTVYDVSIGTAKTLVLSQLENISGGTVLIKDVDSSKIVLGEASHNEVELHFHNSQAWLRILLGNDIGFAEAFMLGEISCSNLTSIFRLLISSPSSLESKWLDLSGIVSLATAPLHRLTNTSEQALTNAANHYSLSNEMFAAFLDPTMTYSAPLWLPESQPDTLEAAQIRKLQYTISAARIKASDHVLEIGTGWGSFAIEAVRSTGCRITTVTASSSQADLARERIASAGLASSIEVLVCDYRKMPHNIYDKIVSIEMIEHVGPQFLKTYFATTHSLLHPTHGIAVFQCITIPESRYASYCSRQDFIQRYIFPGGHLPTVSGLVDAIRDGSQGGLVVEDVKSVSGHYVRALKEWRASFLREWEGKIKPALGEGMGEADMEVFKRKWEYYFCYCEAGFAAKVLGDVSITVGREGAMELIEDIPF